MEPEEIEALREKLVTRRDELRAEGDIELEPVVKDPAEKVDEDAAPLTEMNQVIASRRNKNRALELERIEAALRRLDDDPDEFGWCDDCGDEIGIRRLEVMPWTRHCVNCADARSPRRGARRRHATDFVD